LHAGQRLVDITPELTGAVLDDAAVEDGIRSGRCDAARERAELACLRRDALWTTEHGNTAACARGGEWFGNTATVGLGIVKDVDRFDAQLLRPRGRSDRLEIVTQHGPRVTAHPGRVVHAGLLTRPRHRLRQSRIRVARRDHQQRPGTVQNRQ
jgi:hypothetical protein